MGIKNLLALAAIGLNLSDGIDSVPNAKPSSNPYQ